MIAGDDFIPLLEAFMPSTVQYELKIELLVAYQGFLIRRWERKSALLNKIDFLLEHFYTNPLPVPLCHPTCQRGIITLT